MGLRIQKSWNSSSRFAVLTDDNKFIGTIYAPRGRYWMTVLSETHPDHQHTGGSFPVAHVTDFETALLAFEGLPQ